MAGWLAPVPELSTDVPAAAYPARGLYRDRIRSVAVSGAQMRSTVFSMSQFGHSGGSSYSSYSTSYSSASSRSSGAGAEDYGVNELTTIAHQMYSDGYTRRVLQAFDVASSPALDRALENRLSGIDGGPDGVLEIWFCELDVGWVLQICHCQVHGSRWQLPLSDKSTTSLQDSVERWIRGLTVIVQSIDTLVSTRHEMRAIIRFGKASISKMFVFVEAILSAFKAEKLQAVLDTYICVTNAYMCLQYMMYDHKEVFNAIGDLLSTERERLWEAISSTMQEMRTLVEDDQGLWAMEIKHGGGDVHKNISLVASSIVSLKKTIVLTPRSDGNFNLDVLIDKTADYLNDLLLRKSELCLNPSLRYLFLLNNSYFVASLDLPLYQRFVILQHAPECKTYMDSYLDVSWGAVLSCIQKSHFPRPLHCLINTSSLAKFESAFHKTYQAQKLWKVPDPYLRDVLRRAITGRVVSGYRDYLEEHPELEKHVGHESSSPEVLEEMLGELFEG